MGQFQSINSVESVSTWLKGSGLWQRPRDWKKLATCSQTPTDMPGIPVGDHYPETHTVGAPPQVPVSGSETVSPRQNFPSDILLSRPQKLFRLTPPGRLMLLLHADGALNVPPRLP